MSSVQPAVGPDPSSCAYQPVEARFELNPLTTGVLRRTPVDWGDGAYSEFIMGRDQLYQRGSCPQSNPMAGDTLVVTDRGVVPIEALTGQTAAFFTPEGWRSGSVACRGRQPVQEIRFVPLQPLPQGTGYREPGAARLRRTVVATPDHGWLRDDGATTHALEVGDAVARRVLPVPPIPDDAPAAYLAGFRHGLFFADGTLVHRHEATATANYGLRLCKGKGELAGLFAPEPFAVSRPATYNGDPYVTIRSALDLKSLPPAGSPADYLAGFVAGWATGDGTREPSGAVLLGSQDAVAVDWLLDHVVFAGYTALGCTVGRSMATNFGPRKAPLRRVRLSPARGAWRVEAIAPIQEPVPVYCATVPDAGAIVLAAGIVSGAGR